VKTSSLIGHVVEVLDFVLAGRRPADAVVREFFRARHYLGSSDRRFIAERTFDILRHHRLLTLRCRMALEALPGAPVMPAIPTVMLVAAHEATCAAGESNELESDIGPLWGASVRETDCALFIGALARVELPEELLRDGMKMIAVRHSMPDFVVAEWLERFGAEETDALCAASNGNPPVSIRANTL
jgi:16S rRNA (cytosine967-C5)-methyltransferase